MMATTEQTFQNPIYPLPCPDPFVLKHRGAYWCYFTGCLEAGRCFGILYSPDLVNWQPVGGALEPLPGEATKYWAPEVLYDNGRFYMYYSVGNEERMHLRVAVAEQPQGPFIDSGQRLTQEEFAIDAHVFSDDDGSRYLFYATDFLDHDYIGTGTVCDRMLNPFTLAGNPRPVSRAKYDWQVYDPQRAEKGGVRWHTVEGPFVLKRKGRYYQMFSGGNWQNTTYGVSFAYSEQLDQGDEWEQVCDGEQVLPILRTLPSHGVIGPGHNSVVRGPDNRQLFCIYHRWVEEPEPGRVLAIDRLDWDGAGMVVLGPTTTPQPRPQPPTRAYFMGGDPAGESLTVAGLGPDWTTQGGRWEQRGGAAVQASEDLAEISTAHLALESDAFLLEVTVQALSAGPPPEAGRGTYGLHLEGEAGQLFSLALHPGGGSLEAAAELQAGGEAQTLALPASFLAGVDHLLRLEVDGMQARLAMDGLPWWNGTLAGTPQQLALFTRGMAASFSACELSLGWEELFSGPELGAAWEFGAGTDPAAWQVREEQLWHTGAAPGALFRAMPAGDFELVVNVRMGAGGYGFFVGSTGPLLLEQRANGWALADWRLPEGFDPYAYQHFRFWKRGDRVKVQWQGEVLGEMEVTGQVERVGLYARGEGVAFDMVRLTLSS